MIDPNSKPAKPAYEPTAAQLERAAALTRQNRVYVYAPLIVLAIGVIATFIALLVLTLFAGEDQTFAWQGYVSGIADMVIILTVLPLMAMCALLPISAIALVATGRQNEWKPIQSLRILLWRLEGAIGRLQGRVEQITAPATTYTIRGNGRLSYVTTTLKKFQFLLFGKKHDDPPKQ